MVPDKDIRVNRPILGSCRLNLSILSKQSQLHLLPYPRRFPWRLQPQFFFIDTWFTIMRAAKWPLISWPGFLKVFDGQSCCRRWSNRTKKLQRNQQTKVYLYEAAPVRGWFRGSRSGCSLYRMKVSFFGRGDPKRTMQRRSVGEYNGNLWQRACGLFLRSQFVPGHVFAVRLDRRTYNWSVTNSVRIGWTPGNLCSLIFFMIYDFSATSELVKVFLESDILYFAHINGNVHRKKSW